MKTVCTFMCVFVCRFGVRYELPLLFQSLLMITTMLAMVHLCVKVRREMEIDDHPHRIWGKEVKGREGRETDREEERWKKISTCTGSNGQKEFRGS